jgi:DNA-binding SARP family transcriptional activator/WD40 repeat protein
MATITAQQIDSSNGHNGLQFRVLGPVEVTDGDGHVIDVGGSKPRLVLVQLLLNPGRIVSTDALVDVLWGEDAPPTARRSLQSHVARLRAALGGDDGPLRSQPPGYALAIDEAQVDLWRSEAFARQARTTLASDPRHALQLARQARAEWSGDPFADLADHDPLVPQRQRLDQNRLALRELEVDALLAVGDTSEAVDQLESLVLERPQHEPFWARLMTAYYRLGRQSDALKTFGRARTALMDELGIDPSPELQRLEVAILTQADDLHFEAAASCPYKGLASYQLDDADRFCGRDHLVAELIEAVRSAPFVVVVGSSGAGKSSALRAGLISAIEAGRVAGVAHGSIITPGAAPMRSIYQAPRSADVVIVDQFEELFTLTDDDAVQREFVRVLLASVNDGTRRAVISLRADFYGNCMRIPELAAVVARRQVVVGAMSERELRTVVTQPAERAGLLVDGELVDAIVAEAADHPGALPLVSHALVETWHRRADARLTLDAYREAGSLAGAIARTAENVYGGFTSEQRVQTQRLLLRLVEPGEGSEHTRRRVPFAQLEGSTIDRRVVDVLIEARLLTADGDGVEIAHEALIDAWPRLSSWIEEDRHGLRLHRHLTTAASAWAEVGRDEGELYRGVRLSTALSWIGDSAPDLSQMERDFVKASVDLSEKQLRQQQRANRRLRVLVALSIVGVIVAAGATTLAIRAARDADRRRTEAEAARLVDIVRANPALSEAAVLQLAVAADGLVSTPATQGLLLDTIANESGLVSRGRIDAQPIGTAPISSNGGVVLTQDNNVFGVVFDAETLQPRARGIRSATAVVDTGDRLVGLTGASRSGPTKLEVLDLDSGASLGRLPDLTAENEKVALAPDGKSLAIASPDGGTPEQRVTTYDVATGRQLAELESGRAGSIRHLTFGPDGHYLLATLDGGAALVWNTTTGARVLESTDDGVDITRLAMSPSNSVLAFGRDNGEVEIWALVDDSGDWIPLDVRSPHRERVTWIDFDAEGSQIVSTSADGQVFIWDATTGQISGGPLRFDAASAVTYFRPGSTGLTTIDSNGATWQWELHRAGGLRKAVLGVNLGASVTSTPGTRVIVSSPSGVTIHDPNGGPPTEIRFASQGAVPPVGVSASAGGTRVAVVRADGRVELRETDTGDLVVGFEAPNQAPPNVAGVGFGNGFVIAVDGDGSRVAYQVADGDLVVVDADGVEDVIKLASWRQRLQTLSLNASGSELVLSTTLGEAVWYELDGIEARALTTQGRGFDAHFLDDGRVAVIGLDGVQLIDPRQPEDVDRVVATGGRRLAIDPTGHLLATVDEDGAVQLWDAEGGGAIGEPLPFERELPPTPIRFSADGQYLVASGAHETSWIDVRTTDWTAVACKLVGDRLGGDEVVQILRSVDLSEVCS